MGRIPRRVGFDGRLPSSWADGSRRWDGWLAAAEQPRIVGPAERPHLDGQRPHRGRRQAGAARRRRLRPRARASARSATTCWRSTRRREADMLRGPARRPRAVPGALAEAAARAADARGRREGRAPRARPRRFVDELGRARRRRLRRLPHRARLPQPSLARGASAARRGVRRGRSALRLSRAAAQPGREAVGGAALGARAASARAPARPALRELGRPAAARARRDARRAGRRRHAARGAHVGRAQHDADPAPCLARRAACSRAGSTCRASRLPGDSHMPRVQIPASGASERLAVSPGREEQGYFHMPAGQSGHSALAALPRTATRPGPTGEPTPFLPGPAAQVLTLVPGSR